MSKRFYILFVARGEDGQLRKVPIPHHYLYVIAVGAVIGVLGLTGLASSYVRMLMKVSSYNQLRAEREDLKTRYDHLEQVSKERDIQVASLGSLASEVSSLYGLKPEPELIKAASSDKVESSQLSSSLDRLYTLKTAALTGATTAGLSMGLTKNVTTADWIRANSAPNLWPVEGPVTGSFGERIDPFNGEGAFHRGVDISTDFGHRVLAPADGVVVSAGLESGYGRLVEIQHANGIITRYGHLSAFAVNAGQRVTRGEVIGYVGMSGRSTGPHLHYEVWVHNSPVNPYKFLRMAITAGFAGTT